MSGFAAPCRGRSISRDTHKEMERSVLLEGYVMERSMLLEGCVMNTVSTVNSFQSGQAKVS